LRRIEMSSEPGSSRATGSATLTVTRPAADGTGDQYLISLTLDGAPFARLAPGESASRTIPSGPHRLRATNTLMRKTVSFESGVAEEVHFRTWNKPGPGTSILAALGAGWLYVAIERRPSPSAGAPESP
jgi:hypothetical protein